MAPGLGGLFLTTDMNYLVSRGPTETRMRIYDGQKDSGYLIWKKRGLAGAEPIERPLQTRAQSFKGHVRGSLIASIQSQVNSNWISSRFIDAYILDHQIASIEAGAPFELLVEKKYDQGQFIKYGEVLRTGLAVRGEWVVKHFRRFQKGGVFIGTEDIPSDRPFYAPVDYLRIASTFQPHRRHPITGRVQPHLGIDFEMPSGSPVYAPRKGSVVRLGRSRAAGNYLVILHPNGIETSYNHLRRLETGLREGSRVQAGQRIGIIGNTGYSTRPHLHFAVRVHGRMVDPAGYLKAYPLRYENSLQSQVAAKD